MYRLNELKRNVLCTPDEVIFHAPTDQAPDPRQVLNAIIIAEERFIVDALSYDFYQVLIEEKNTVVSLSNLTELQDKIFVETEIETVLKVGDVVNSESFLSADNLKLWRQYLWKLCAECVLLIAMPTSYIKFAASGMVHAQPGSNSLSASGVVTPSLASMKWIIDQVILNRIDPLLVGMQNYICKFKGLYPTYANYCACNDKQAEETKHKRTDFILGIYDKEDKCNCNGWDQFNGL